MKKLTLILFCLFSLVGYSQTLTTKQAKTINKLFKHKTEVYFTFNISNPSEITTLTRIISIDNVKNGVVWAYANKNEFTKFIVLNYKYKILTNPCDLIKVKTKSNATFGMNKTVTAYPTYPAYEALMSQYATTYPSICKLVNIGTLPSGRKLLALKITDNVNVREDEPQFLYTSSMHGDETAGYADMLNFIDYLLTNYGTNPRVTSMINNVELWINPLANPDGTYAGGNTTVNGATRYNANFIDLNRNYPDPAAGQHPDGNAWQPETVYWMAFADSVNLTQSANFHGGSEVVNYPWDTWAALHADNNWWMRESHKYADTAQANAAAGYFTSVNANGITDGYAWYTITGGRQDYMNYFKHCREVTIELSNTKLIPTTEFASNYSANVKSFMNYIEESERGIRGIIKDACTNQPIKAKVFITGHDFDSSHVYSALPIGDYHRLIYQGTYNVTFSAPGYVSQTINGVNVVDGIATVLNINLSPTPPVSSFALASMDNCSGVVNFSDMSGSANTWSWHFGDGTTSNVQNPTHIYTASGTYNVSLAISNCAGSDSLYQSNFITINVTSTPVTQSDSSLTCLPASLTLTATSAGTINWYDAPTGGNLVGTGSSFVTPVLNTTTSYYAENVVTGASQYVGPVDNTIGTGNNTTSATYHYLKFTSSVPFTLVSVWVSAGTAGNRTIELRNSGGTVLQSAVVNVPAGASRITLNFAVPVGTNLQLGTAGGSNMYRNQSGAVYPYTLAGIVSITGYDVNSGPGYYFFYDWEVAASCSSARAIATATINPSTPVANAISSADTSICAGASAVFTANATNGGNFPVYQWLINGSNAASNINPFTTSALNNGDVVTCIVTSSNTCASNNPASSNSINVLVHPLPTTPVVTQAGTVLNSNASSGNQWYATSSGMIGGANATSYTPSVSDGYYTIVTDSYGCTSAASNTIQFVWTGIASFSNNSSVHLYPNPAGEEINVDINAGSNSEVTIEVYNTIGKQIFSETTSEPKTKINCTNYANGIYFLTVKSGNEIHTEKFIVKKIN